MFSNVLSRAIPFALLPVLTRYLSPGDLGTVAMYVLAVSLAVPLVGMSTDTAVGRQYFERETIDFPVYVTTCLYIAFATAVVLGVVVAAFSGMLASMLAVPAPWLWTVVLLALAKFLSSTTLVLWQMRQKPKQYAAYSIAQTALALGISVLLIVGFGFGWTGRAIGEIGSLVVAGGVAAFILVRGRWVRYGLNREYLSHALRYGGGLIPHVYGGLLIAATDRLFITNMLGVAETGLYVVGVQIGMIIGVLEHSFNQAWAPWLFGVLKRGDPADGRRIARFRWFYNGAILSLALGLAAVAPWFLGFFVGDEFGAAAQFVFWLALGNAFSGMYKMVVNEIFFANKTHWLAWITLLTGVLNIGFNYVLISRNGAVGAAQATALALFISYFLTARLSARVSTQHFRT